ncbi:bifunctional DNA primase/polymerase [Gordonia sp. ABSL11-1]|uniref:bifunctional DNA primase/polymerase n=1 Tax=Gordonia sp. ABSL11-1 TaxID=3053924 RepID=UPI002572EF9B|nr:bifunctional DNA primase/polymerase [Gordonia sp. ABSL11-1]MDL9944279.1 bifunctional DNA primase/polymerase [Gordonia sp. ABSL11-1]
MTDLATAAIDYATRGLPIFPLVPRTKRPATAHGKDDATADVDQVDQWWRDNPNANIGLRPPTGFVVIDVDPRAGGSLDHLGSVPPTRIAATGGHGHHIWLRHSCERVRGRLAGAPGIDLKTDTGYVVVPPSVHPNGNQYRWVSEYPVAWLPEHLTERVSAAVYKTPSVPTGAHGRSADRFVGLVQTVSTAAEGNRNHLLFWACCRAIEGGADPAVFVDLVHAAVKVGLAEAEAQRTVQSAMRRAAA